MPYHNKLVLLCVVTVISQVSAVFRYGEQSETLTDNDGRIRAVRNHTNKDFVLGGLFPVHTARLDSAGGGCGGAGETQGVEAMLFALDLINADTQLLPGLEIGYDIRDTCGRENVGLDEVLGLIITGDQVDIESCESSVTSMNGNVSTSTLATFGLVGAALSAVSISVASLGRLFQVPQVSYSSSSKVLSNKDLYTYFYRTIPPDNFQVRAIVDLLLYFNWTYVSIIFSRDAYGQPAVDELRTLVRQFDICFDLEAGIDDDADYENIVRQLNTSQANVVVLFATQVHALRMLRSVSNSVVRTRFTWIGSDSWAGLGAALADVSETVAGYYGIQPLTQFVPAMENYLSQLTIQSNRRNSWFPEMYAVFAQCELNVTCDTTGNLTSAPGYRQNSVTARTVDAVYALAHALNNFLAENCDTPLVWNRANQTCTGQIRDFNGSALLEYLSNVTFASPSQNIVSFDEQGNFAAMYQLVNYQRRNESGGNEYLLEVIGTWSSSFSNESSLGFLQIDRYMMQQFGIDGFGNSIYEPPFSQCACQAGEYRQLVGPNCCGRCDPCLGQSFSEDGLSINCRNCPEFLWGNNPLEGSSRCVAVRESFIDFSDASAIAVVIISILGLLCTAFVAIVFGLFWTTPVVKSSGREQMVLLLIGIGLCFVVALIYVSPPSLAICIFQRIGLWFCFSLIFGALLVKIVRVARIFLGKPTLKRLRFAKMYHQVVFTFLLVLGQMLLVAAFMAFPVPGILRTLRRDMENTKNFPVVVLTCITESNWFLGLSAIYESVILIVATMLGSLSFRYPENFNEAKYVCFCTFALLVIWIAFLPTYFATQMMQEFQNAVIAFAIIMSALVILACLFGPKLYIILFCAKRNSNVFSHHPPTEPKDELPMTSTPATHASTPMSHGSKCACCPLSSFVV